MRWVGCAVSVVFFLTSCTSARNTDSEVANKLSVPDSAIFGVWKLGGNDILKFSDFFTEEYELVRLETSVECLVGEVSDLVQFRDRFLVFDGRQGTLLIFDRDGRYINKIFPQGRGPLEVNQITDFTVNPKKGTIDVFDFTRQKIVSYNMDGSAVSELGFPYYARELSADSLGNYIVYSPDIVNNVKGDNIPCGLFWVDEKARYKNTLLAFPLPKSYFQPVRCLSGSGDDIIFISNYYSGIFKISNGSVSKLFEIDGENDWLYSYTLTSSFGDSGLFLYTNLENLTATGFYSHSTGKHKTVLGLNNDLFLLPIFIPDKYIGVDKIASVVSSLDALRSMEMIKKADRSELSNYFGEKALKKFMRVDEDVLSRIDPDDNPLIFIFNKKNET